MCLAKVYLGQREERKLLGEEVAKIERRGKSVMIRDLFGESREFENCFVREVDLMDNYVILDRE